MALFLLYDYYIGLSKKYYSLQNTQINADYFIFIRLTMSGII